MLLNQLENLTRQHLEKCDEYRHFIQSIFPTWNSKRPENLPYLPVRAFKEFDLKSISEEQIFKVMTSSGTTGQPSRIFLDKDTAHSQTRTLVEIFSDTFGKGRFPMLVIDCERTVKDRANFSARTAAINGFSTFSRGRAFALNDDMSLNLSAIRSFLDAHADKQIFMFGFTFLIWSAFTRALAQEGVKLDLKNAFLLHGGGWKKLESENISDGQFKELFAQTTGCTNVRNYYGMIEQTGTIFMECAHGNMHASKQSDVLIRDMVTHQPLGHHNQGLIQVMSGIQSSYPGHSILTEDVGITLPASTCPCGSSGTIVKIHGRLQSAEVRGCSDAYH